MFFHLNSFIFQCHILDNLFEDILKGKPTFVTTRMHKPNSGHDNMKT